MAEFRRAPNEAAIVDPRTGRLTVAWAQWFQRLGDLVRALDAETASDILTALLGVDGAGSGLDADLLDGQQGSAYQTVAGLLTAILAIDGTGSGVDADLLDGQHGAFYQDADNINAGTLADARIASTIARDSEVTAAIAALSSVYLALSGGTLTGNLNGVTPTELGYLSGVTSPIQTQLNGKEPTQTLKRVYVQDVDTTATARSTTGLLFSHTIAANTFTANKQGLRCTVWGNKTGANGAATIQVQFGETPTTISSMGLTSGSIDHWKVIVEVIRTGTGSAVLVRQILADDPSYISTPVASFQPSSDIDWTAEMKLDFNLSSVNASDTITQYGARVEYMWEGA